MTRISKRNTLLTLEYPFNGPRDSAGHKEQSWVAYRTVWAYIRKLSGSEVIDGEQVSNFSTFECRIPFLEASTLTTHWRLRQGSSAPYTYYEINSADQNEFNRREWILTVTRDDRNQVDAATIEV